MTDKQQPEALRLANVCSNLTRYSMDAHLIAAYLRSQHAELETLRAKLKVYEDLGGAADDVQLLRMGYAAARLEIESLRKEHADELTVAYMCGASWEKELAAQQPGASRQAPASSAVLKAIREANLQLVRTDDDAFMLVTLKQPAPQQDDLDAITLIAECRDAFPTPEHGSPIENEWMAACSDPSEVPGYMRAIAGRMAQPSPQQEPVGWYVTGCGRLLDEHEAKTEAKHIGGTASAVPLYTTPQPVEREPLTANQVSGLAESAGYWHGDMSRADFINGIRYAEAAHGIRGGQHGAE